MFMTIRTGSWILAILYLIWGSIAFCLLPTFDTAYTELFGSSRQLPFLTRAVLFPRALGWLLTAIFIAALVISKASSIHARLLNRIFLFLLGGLIFFGVIALFLPMMVTITQLEQR